MNSRREAGLALLGGIGGAVLTLFAASRPWADGQAVQGTLRAPLEVSGGSLVPVVPALGLAALAGVLAVLATRGWARAVVGAVLALCGLVVAGAALAQRDPDSGELARRAGDALGTATATATGGGTAWPWLAVVGGLLIATAGLATAARGRGWPAMSSRYERPVGGEESAVRAPSHPRRTAETPLDQWRAIDRGEDPTDGPVQSTE
ncbi:TIGR02234 family membrane protein [Sporichthya brevicatena]|uniref:TIGR02234 family membrane protein n=1 Tax=Sporichthya brevicatena TaxID=171442 RepID=A0ABN1GSL7_9ACTN